MSKRAYDSTVARMAGNIAAGMLTGYHHLDPGNVVKSSVNLARAIIAEVERTEPAQSEKELHDSSWYEKL
jgi:hypothetical protein